METTPDQQRVLKMKGWWCVPPARLGYKGERWSKASGPATVCLFADKGPYWQGDPANLLEFAVITGTLPEGYRLVPVNSMADWVDGIEKDYDVDDVTRRLEEFMEEPDEEEES